MGPQPHRMINSDRAAAPVLPQSDTLPGTEAPAPRIRVLVADDEKRIRLALRACLEADGYEVCEAADGNEALDLIVQRAPDVMILDLAMPNLDGIRTLSKLAQVHGRLKPRIIMLTAWGSCPAARIAIGLGAMAFLEKPLAPETLLWTVRKVLLEHPDSKSDSEVSGDARPARDQLQQGSQPGEARPNPVARPDSPPGERR